MTAEPLPTITVIAIDSGTVKCGWAVATVNLLDKRWYPSRWGLVERESSVDPVTRCVSIAKEVVAKVSPVTGRTLVVIEKPGGSVYKGKQNSENVNIGRMSKLQQVFMLVGCLAMIGDSTPGLTYRVIEPSQWQLSKKKRGGLDTKTWSIWKANHLLFEVLKLNVVNRRILQDNNVCDAINIAAQSVINLLNGKWIAPVYTQVITNMVPTNG